MEDSGIGSGGWRWRKELSVEWDATGRRRCVKRVGLRVKYLLVGWTGGVAWLFMDFS